MGDTWHLDEVFVTIQGRQQYLWRAVDEDGDVLDILVPSHRNRRAAGRFFRTLLKAQGRIPRRLITDPLRSYAAAGRTVMPSVVHVTDQYANNRAEVSHQPTRHRGGGGWRMREGPPSLVAGAGSGVPAGSRRAPIKRWCGRRESNPHEPCGPTDFRTASAFAALVWRVHAGWPGLRSGLSLHHPADDCRGLGAARLVSTPSRTVCRPSLARDRHFKGFPEFGQFCTAGFPAGTQVRLKSVASAIPPRPQKPLYL